MDKNKNNIFSALAIAAAIIVIIGLVIYRKSTENDSPGEKLLPERRELSNEEILERLSAPENAKPFKPDPELLKKLTAPGK